MSKKVKPPQSSILPSQRILLDWKRYFYNFCNVHGEPIEHKGRLLFRDGWGYSLTSYEGPEFHPPLDNKELDVLVTQYWIIRRSNTNKQLQELQHTLEQLSKIQDAHSIPLQQVVTRDDRGTKVRDTTNLSLDGLEQKLRWLQDDMIECDERLKEIEEYNKGKSIGTEL